MRQITHSIHTQPQTWTRAQKRTRRPLALLAVLMVVLLGLGAAPAQAFDLEPAGPTLGPLTTFEQQERPDGDPPGGEPRPPEGQLPDRPAGPVAGPVDLGDGTPTPPAEPPTFEGEPTTPSVAYEVLVVMSDDDQTVLRPAPGSKLPVKTLPATETVNRAKALANAWTSKGYRASILYAPASAGEIHDALRRIADRYALQATRPGSQGTELGQIAIHYEGHGGTGTINTAIGNDKHVNITHAAIGAATARAFPAGAAFDSLDVVAVFDACHQHSALAQFTDALLAGRKNGTTHGRTISSTGPGDDVATCKAAVGLFSDAFLAGYAGSKPSLTAVDAAFAAGVTAQRRALSASPGPPALGKAAMREY